MEEKITASIKKTEAEARKMLEEAEQKVHRIIEEARKTASEEASKIFKEIERDIVHIIDEAIKKADADAEKIVAQAEKKAHEIIEEAKRIQALEDKEEKRKAAFKQRAELVIVPPIDTVQFDKLRVSLQQLAHLQILSMWGTSEGGASVFAVTDRPASLVQDLRRIDVVDEAMEIGEELLGSDLIKLFVKKNMPLRPSKRNDEQRVLVLLKGVGQENKSS